jgi:hypothetical protein
MKNLITIMSFLVLSYAIADSNSTAKLEELGKILEEARTVDLDEHANNSIKIQDPNSGIYKDMEIKGRILEVEDTEENSESF